MDEPGLHVGQAVRLRTGSAWDGVLRPNAVGVVIGVCGPTCYRVAFPTRDGRPPLVGEFFLGELLVVR